MVCTLFFLISFAPFPFSYFLRLVLHASVCIPGLSLSLFLIRAPQPLTLSPAFSLPPPLTIAALSVSVHLCPPFGLSPFQSRLARVFCRLPQALNHCCASS
ncbi:MAG: hypothetical protein BYD32DRAFT_407722 [Podila humilis]|nr:MAG: hypothetical protein BYD32DRAFT_407722 [Podila humilis]